MKKLRKLLLRHLLRTLLLLLVLTAFLLSPPGLRLITPLLEERLSNALHAQVILRGLQLRTPLALRLEALSIQNEAGHGLHLEDLDLRVSLRALLDGRIHIRHLHLDELRLSDLPFGTAPTVQPDPPPDQPPRIPHPSELFGAAQVDSLRIRSLQIHPPLLGERLSASLSAELSPLFLHSEIEIQDLPNFGNTKIQLSATPESSVFRLKLLGTTAQGELNALGRLDAFTSRLELHATLHVPDVSPENALAELDLNLHPGGLDLKLSLPTLPLNRLGAGGHVHPDATVKGHFRMQGPLDDPTASLELDFEGLRPESDDQWDGPPASLLVRSQQIDSRLRSELRLENLPGDPIVLNLELPLRLSLLPFELHVPPEQPLAGSFHANTDLRGLSRLAVLDVYHSFTGSLVADASLGGSLANPQLTGKAELLDGSYEHELIGLLLRNVELSLSARRDELVIDLLRAADGGGGYLDITGTLRMNPADGFLFAMDINLRDFHLIHHDLANVTALGALNWKGSLDESRMSGQVRMNPVELRIPERLPPALIPLEVIEIHEVAPDIELTPETPRSSSHRVLFDLKLDAPDRVHVRGNGLDSEWSARLRLQGDSREPKLLGTIDLLRGRFLFFGRRMLLTRGRVQFDGAYPPEPILDVAVELRGGGILGILEVRGPSSNPEIQLSSQPMLPEDEILARLLFGRESARITPWQALTLAQALNRLRGGGSTFDFMGETRRILRVDQVEVRSDEEAGDTSITVGRYLSDRIYVELERGIATEAGRARVEVELTPQLRLETETGGMTDTGIGIIWTRDF